MPKIVFFSGCKRSGKDTVVNKIIQNKGGIKIAYADALREICSILYGFTEEDYELRKEMCNDALSLSISPRDALCLVGTELFRKQVDPDIWVKIVIRRIRKLSKEYEYIFISDARFLNEIEMVKKAFPEYTCYSFLIIRPDVLPGDGISSAHESEHFGILQSIETSYVFDGVYINHTLSDVDVCVSDIICDFL
jgi:hypothetical protein